MEYNGLLYKHIHPRLISKDLFDECKAVRTGRRKVNTRRTEKEFILKGLLSCKACGCIYSPELKKGKYVYMRPTKSKGECSYCFHLNENKILKQIQDVIKGISIPKDVLLEINKELKLSSDFEHKAKMNDLIKVKEQYEKVQVRIKRTRDLFLDSQFSKEEYDETILSLMVERQNLEAKLTRLSKADEEFNKSLTTIFELASKAHELFKSSDGSKKRRIITILFPNLLLEGEKLLSTLRKPFDLMVNLGACPMWLPGMGTDLSGIRPPRDLYFINIP